MHSFPLLAALVAATAVHAAGSTVRRQHNIASSTPANATAAAWPAPGWQQQYKAGFVDSAGRYAGGSETVHVEGYGNRLFAAIGYWEDERNCNYQSPGGSACHDPEKVSTGWAQVVRMDEPGGPWVVDLELGIGPVRTEVLKTLTFTTDGTGKALSPPATMLVAGAFSASTYGQKNATVTGVGAFIWIREDATGTWTKTTVVTGAEVKRFGPLGSVRAISVHRDSVTGIDRCFVTVGMQGIWSGTYDRLRKLIVWDAAPEPQAQKPTVRPLGQAQANGKLYYTSGQYLFERVDGPSPRWRVAHDFAIPGAPPPNSGIGGLRGLSRVKNPNGQGGDSLLIIWTNTSTNQGCMYRLDPILGSSTADSSSGGGGSGSGGGGFTQHLEVCLATLMSEYLGGAPVLYTLGAYNQALPLHNPTTNTTSYLIGFLARIPCKGREGVCTERKTPGVGPSNGGAGYYAGAVFFLRQGPADYKLNEVAGRRPLHLDEQPHLVATRSYALSPFASEQTPSGVPSAVYFGGYDCNGQLAPTNTAWVFRGSIDAVTTPLCCGDGEPESDGGESEQAAAMALPQ